MVRALAPTLALIAAACATAPDQARPQARIAENVALTLPLPPAYPDTRAIMQTVRARYGEREGAFEAIVSLSPERAEIVLTILGGPRLATITWDENGVDEERSALAPLGLPVENILADIFMTTWPADAVAEALPGDARLIVGLDGARTIEHDGAILVSVTPDATDPNRVVVRNAAFGYEVAIISQILDQ